MEKMCMEMMIKNMQDCDEMMTMCMTMKECKCRNNSSFRLLM